MFCETGQCSTHGATLLRGEDDARLVGLGSTLHESCETVRLPLEVSVI